MDINSLSIEQLVEYVNNELENRTLKDIEVEDFMVNPRVISKRLARKDYKRIGNKYIKGDNTSNTTSIKTVLEYKNIVPEQVDNTSSITTLGDAETQKLKLLLDNLDNLLKLVGQKSNTSSITIKSTETKVTSLRINAELYNIIKDRALKNKISISDIVNRALEDYLRNYLE